MLLKWKVINHAWVPHCLQLLCPFPKIDVSIKLSDLSGHNTWKGHIHEEYGIQNEKVAPICAEDALVDSRETASPELPR